MDMALTFLADMLMVAAALGAAVYCFVLSRRVSNLNSIDKGLGGAIAVLSAQVDDMNRVLEATKSGSDIAAARLESLTHQARGIADNLETMIAACHDLADPDLAPGPALRGDDTITTEIDDLDLADDETQDSSQSAAIPTPLFSTPAPQLTEQDTQEHPTLCHVDAEIAEAQQ